MVMLRILIFFYTFLHVVTTHTIPTIHTIGDSHSFFSFSPVPFVPGSNTYPKKFAYTFFHHDRFLKIPFQINWIGARTMHRVARDGLDFLDVKKFLIKKNDYVVFVFGEIDVRCHIVKQKDLQGISLEEIIDRLAYNYIATVVANKDRYGVHAIVCGVVPPTNNKPNPEFPVYGSLEERIRVTKTLNAYLEKLCVQNNLLFLNVYDNCATQEGDFNATLSDGNVHVAIEHNDFIRQKLLRLIADHNPTFYHLSHGKERVSKSRFYRCKALLFDYGEHKMLECKRKRKKE